MLRTKLNGRDAAHFDVVYHADPYSKYLVAPPVMVVPPRDSKPVPGINISMREMCVCVCVVLLTCKRIFGLNANI